MTSFSPRTWIFTAVAAILLVVVVIFWCSSGVAPAPDAPNGKALSVAVPPAAPKNIPALTGLLQHTDPEVAATAAQRLGETKSADAVAPLLVAAQDSRPVVQAAAVGALRFVQPQVDPAAIIDIVESTPQAPVRAAALDFLAVQKVRKARAYALMIKCLDDPDVEVRGRAYAGICALTGRDYSFRAEDPPAKRADAIRRIRLTIPKLPS